MADADLPPLDACGFVRVPTDPTATEPLWLTCDSCKKSDHFWIDGDTVHCRCGATYTSAVRPDGRAIPTAELTFVPWKEGPMQLADTEFDPMRLTLVLVLVAGVLGGLGVLAWWLVA